MTETLSAAAARRMMLGAQGFAKQRPERVTARHLHGVIGRLGVLQIDSVNVFARAHYMPPFARLGSFEPALVDRTFISRTTHYVEYPAHEASFIPIGDWPLWRFRMEAFHRRWSEDEDSWYRNNHRTLAWVRDELRHRGPSKPADIRGDAPRSGGAWWDWDDVKLALEHLWRTGEVAIAGRVGFERRYGLAEEVIPSAVHEVSLSTRDALTELVRRAARAYGVATASDLNDYYRLRHAQSTPAITQLIDSGELMATTVSGWEKNGRPIAAWRHRDATLPRRIEATAILSPFDPVVWFRERALRAFGLDYRIEIYTLAARRQFGYYSLPVLIGDRIAARVDLKADRASSTLRVQSAWWEASASDGDAERLASELEKAAEWQGLENISISNWGTATEDLAIALGNVSRHTRKDDA